MQSMVFSPESKKLIGAYFPIHEAIAQDDWNGFLKALENFPIDQRNKANTSPLLLACEMNKTAYALTLIHNNADVSLAENGAGATPMHQACFHCNIDLIQALNKAGANLDESDQFSKVPYHYTLLGNCNEQSKCAAISTLHELEANLTIPFPLTPKNPVERARTQELTELADLLKDLLQLTPREIPLKKF